MLARSHNSSRFGGAFHFSLLPQQRHRATCARKRSSQRDSRPIAGRDLDRDWRVL